MLRPSHIALHTWNVNRGPKSNTMFLRKSIVPQDLVKKVASVQGVQFGRAGLVWSVLRVTIGSGARGPGTHQVIQLNG